MKAKETIIKNTAIIFLFALIVILTFFIINGWVGGHFNSTDSLKIYVHSFGMWAPLVLILIQILQVIVPILPGFAGCIVGTALFGAVGGFWVNYIGISIGSIIAYWLAKRFGSELVNKMVSMEKHKSYIERISRSKSYPAVLFFSILLPLAPDDFLCYFSGLIKMSAKKFITIIIVGKPWCILFYSIFFAYFI